MTDFSIGETTRAASETRSASRLLFVDNIRWSMIILVLSMHACDTYSPFGNWYYVDRQQGLGTALFFGVYQSFLQAFFMAALFFIAGYFSAAAYDRKGFASFVRAAALALALSVPLFAALVVFGGGLEGETARYAGGFNPVSAGKCLWEALVCVGMGLLMLVVYRRYFDAQGPLARWLSDNAFGVYLIHPPVVIGSAILLHTLAWNAIAKALLLTVLAAVGSFATSAFVLRKSPLRVIV